MLIRLSENRVAKPWGRTDLPEQFGGTVGEPLGEIWFQRKDGETDPLLVKYLFTSERLSVQVHPEDEAARGAGHLRGKDEAWIVLDAAPDACIGIGLKRPATAADLKAAAHDGSIVDLLDWRAARPGDAYYSPAGTLHSIGPGLTLLEVQQNCDITYRLYDFGRPRELHLEDGIAVADLKARVARSREQPLEQGRSIVTQGPKFTLERWVLGGRIGASALEPMWLIPIRGAISSGVTKLDPGSVWIATEPVSLELDPASEIIVAYEGSAVRPLL